MNLQDYLEGNKVTEIGGGKSGAEVYELNGDTILKHIVRWKLKPYLFDTCTREALFYQSKADNTRGYLPKLLKAEISDDEIILVIKKYARPDRRDINESLLRKITGTLARIHTDTVPAFLECDRKPAELPDEKYITDTVNGWKSVLDEHPGVFDAAPLDAVAEKIRGIVAWHDSEERVLVHGDFHWDNLLVDGQGNILACDWQVVSVGRASDDLGFFMNRLGADGIILDPESFLRLYADALRKLTGRVLDTKNVIRHIRAANVIASFFFWHLYIHGSDTGRVRGIYERMIDDFRAWESLPDSSK